MTTTERNESVADPRVPIIMGLLAEILCVEEKTLDPDSTFADMGLDSVLSVEFASQLRSALGVSVRAAEFYEHNTPKTLAANLAE